jgi:ketosteroid isomerase-like protein
MKRLIAPLFLSAAFQLAAQNNIDSLINAEKSFAAYSVAHGTRAAFLSFLDSNGVVFDQGKAVNGIQVWEKRKNAPMILNWKPQYVELASSNDFGYTTGPWELKPSATPDSVVARGHFTTVWHLNADSYWKCLVDLGVGNSPKDLPLTVEKISKEKLGGDTSLDQLRQAEKDFIDEYRRDKLAAYQAHLSKKSILMRNGPFHPATEKKPQSQMIKDTPADIEFDIVGSGMSGGGDLAFVYGNTVLNSKRENYLHIWRREKTGWKIAVEVLRY